MDIVYPYRQSDWCELKFSLRSLKHIDYDDVYIIGNIPDYIDKRTVKFIEQPRIEFHRNTYDVVEKLLTMCDVDKLSDDFILMNDDFIFLEDQEIEIYDLGTLRNHIRDRKEDGYRRALLRTFRLLTRRHNYPKDCKSFEAHYPIILNKDKFKYVFNKVDYDENVVWRSFYGNMTGLESKEISQDFKYKNIKQFRKFKNRKFISLQTIVKDEVRDFIRSKFPNKSKYEKQNG